MISGNFSNGNFNNLNLFRFDSNKVAKGDVPTYVPDYTQELPSEPEKWRGGVEETIELLNPSLAEFRKDLGLDIQKKL